MTTCLPFYKTKAWQVARRQALHDAGHRCQRCGVLLVGMGRGAHVHHRKELLRAPALATEPLNLKALCRSCHDAEHHAMKRGYALGCDVEGRPLDRDHPWATAKKAAGGESKTHVEVAKERRAIDI